ncbi:MFS transporter [Actinokineospora fastidiosa]|uniref:MFS transporter n=1 Tax=Actinokineospora fastidiosa TaxID=1816 RepID=A0A918GIM8_9PSEU|nr:MFS transporter [Actinokineospora fastidiosa]GGS37363.1 MFS transporter [Actinokineospora fastidiosa]
MASERGPVRLPADAGLSTGMVTLFAVAAGMAVANIYYAQPLLTAIAREFGVGSGAASQLVTVTTAGYALGLVLVVPLADMRDRRRLVVTLLGIVAVLQALSAAAPTLWALTVLSGLMSVPAVVAPIMVAFAATLAAPEQRGRATGTVMSGVLVGVLLARAGGGLVADWAGSWRAVHLTAAALMVGLAVVLHRRLPDAPVGERTRYRALLRSVATIVREEPVLRLRCVYGFLGFAGFSAFWASSAFLLGGPPHDMGEALIGAFGLLGVVGAIAARTAGRFVDRGREKATTGVLLALVLASWGVMAVDGGHWLPALVIGAIALDLGVQGVQVTNLSVIYRLRPQARARVTMAYTGTYFLGGALGSAASGIAYAAGGWPAVCLTGAVLAAAALGVWVRVG